METQTTQVDNGDASTFHIVDSDVIEPNGVGLNFVSQPHPIFVSVRVSPCCESDSCDDPASKGWLVPIADPFRNLAPYFLLFDQITFMTPDDKDRSSVKTMHVRVRSTPSGKLIKPQPVLPTSRSID